jgi:hypothetical protein
LHGDQAGRKSLQFSFALWRLLGKMIANRNQRLEPQTGTANVELETKTRDQNEKLRPETGTRD